MLDLIAHEFRDKAHRLDNDDDGRFYASDLWIEVFVPYLLERLEKSGALAGLTGAEEMAGLLREVLNAPVDHEGVRQGKRYVAVRLPLDLRARIRKVLS